LAERTCVDAVIYAPLEAEYSGVQSAFRPSDQIDGDSYTGYLHISDDGRRIAVVTGLEGFGNTAAQDVWRNVLSDLAPKLAICVGIAGAISKDAHLGDVYYAELVFDLTQRSKEERDENGNHQTAYDPEPLRPSRAIAKALSRHRLAVEEASDYRKWQQASKLRNEGFLATKANLSDFADPSRPLSLPVAKAGKIAATNSVIATKEAGRDIKRASRKFACVDNESAGFMRELQRHPDIPTLIVRGISDFADEGKAALEDEHSEVFRKLAIRNAVSYLKDVLPLAFQANEPPAQEGNGEPTPLELLEQALSDNANDVHEMLRDRSIMHKLTDNPGLIPVPRVRYQKAAEEDDLEDDSVICEIAHALEDNGRLFVDVPLNYPDSALPWHYATALLDATIDDRLVIPVVVEWHDFSPPNRGIVRLLKTRGLETVINKADYQIVLIFPDFRMDSKPKSNFLKSELDQIRNASVLIFSNEKRVSGYGDAATEILATEHASVQAVSFESIIHYMNSALDMELNDAEVSAKRLISVFHGHRLPIHPSYIASLSKDAIGRLLEANRRGELVELMVAGLLSILVADDASGAVLSRTGREEFLSKLAVEIYVEKKQFDKIKLVRYVDNFNRERNLGLDSYKFIDSFEQSGVIDFSGGNAEISIPIIRSYMIAKGLLDDNNAAISYFDLDDPNFDFNSFDLYCEYSRDLPVLNTIEERLDASSRFFEKKLDQYDEVVTDGKYPAQILERGNTLPEMSKRLSKEAEELAGKTALASEKQALLDIREQVAQTNEGKKVSRTDSDRYKNEFTAMRNFYAATLMLGTGVERLKAEQKDRIIRKILRLGEQVITDVLTLQSDFDPASAISDVANAMIEQHGLTFEDDDEAEAFNKFVRDGILMWDFRQALNPIMLIGDMLCETGRSRLLLSPLSDVETDTILEHYLITSWAFDMSPRRTSKWPKELSKRIGHAKFLRLAFGIFFYNRSFWYHSDIAERQAIADGVNEVIGRLALSQKPPTNDAETTS